MAKGGKVREEEVPVTVLFAKEFEPSAIDKDHFPTSVGVMCMDASPLEKVAEMLLTAGLVLGIVVAPMVGALPLGSFESRVIQAKRFLAPAYSVATPQFPVEGSFFHIAIPTDSGFPAICGPDGVSIIALSEKEMLDVADITVPDVVVCVTVIVIVSERELLNKRVFVPASEIEKR